MKKILSVLLIAIAFTSCDYREQELMTVCTCEQKIEVKNFIKESIKNANNMSDEEMEDVIAELRRTGFKVICDKRMIDATFDGSNHGMLIQHTILDSCETIIRRY